MRSVLAFAVLEIALLVALGSVVGAGWVFLLLLAGVVVGIGLVRREGRLALRTLRATPAGVAPPRGVRERAMVGLGGLLIAVPGLLTDVLGLLLVLPGTRPLVRRLLLTRLLRRVGPLAFLAAGSGRPGVIEGEVIKGEVIKGRAEVRVPEPPGGRRRRLG